MLKRLAFACAAAAALTACGVEPEPRPDPELVERIAEAAAPEAPKLAKAERLAAAVDRSEPDRLAGAAEALLER